MCIVKIVAGNFKSTIALQGDYQFYNDVTTFENMFTFKHLNTRGYFMWTSEVDSSIGVKWWKTLIQGSLPY